MYDHDKFRNYLHGGAITFFALGSLFDFLLIFFADRVKNFYDDEDELKIGQNVNKAIEASVEASKKSDHRESISLQPLNLNGDHKVLFIDEMSPGEG